MPARQWLRIRFITASSSLRLAMEALLALSCLPCASCLPYSTSASLCGKTSQAVRHYEKTRRGDSFYAHSSQTAMDVGTGIRHMLRRSNHYPDTLTHHLFRWTAHEW